jgi:hypothetical protein
MNAPTKPTTISARSLVHLENVGVPAAVDALAKAPDTRGMVPPTQQSVIVIEQADFKTIYVTKAEVLDWLKWKAEMKDYQDSVMLGSAVTAKRVSIATLVVAAVTGLVALAAWVWPRSPTP